VSSAIKEEAVSYGLEHAKAWVIHPAVDANFFFPSPATLQVASNHDINMIKLITVGSLVWTKGYEYALTSIRRLVDEGLSVSLDIIGDGPDRQRVLYTIRDMHLESEVRLLGKLAPGRVRDHLQQSDIFVLSSLSEGLSNAVLEAMACGLPVVSTDCGGMSEAITEGIEGFLVPVRQPTAMAKRISDLARDAGLRSQMGRAGRMQVLNKFGQQSQVDRFVAMFCSCVGLPEPQTCTHHQ
jgi:colanic acid/amylovoran biosynthesis glycosyltransferase